MRRIVFREDTTEGNWHPWGDLELSDRDAVGISDLVRAALAARARVAITVHYGDGTSLTFKVAD